ncbi:MAG: ABC transporter ATP-binding protein [Ginsengibacter sp.]
MVLLEVQYISKRYPDKVVIDDISFQQEPLQKIAITGESGAGKSTLLKIISGYVAPDSGVVMFNGVRVIGPEEQLYPGHKEIAYLSQHYELLNNYYVKDLIWHQIKIEEEAAAQLFAICRISHLLERKTNEISGGEKQRIALCMLLVKSPKMLILDEPFSNLDPIHTDILKLVLEEITGKLQITCLLTSHDPHDTLSWADEIIVMKEGKIIQQGTPATIYHQPVDEYVAGIFGKYNLLKPEQAAMFGIETNGKDVMIRPEEFIISKSDGVKGVIQKISFWGSFYEVEVFVGDLKIVVRVMKNEWEVGEEIYLNTYNGKYKK